MTDAAAGGALLTADIENCRILLIRPPAQPAPADHRDHRICGHHPPAILAAPTGRSRPRNGRYLVTEINGDWATEMDLRGHVYWSTHPPGVAYPSDTNEVYPGRYLTVDYSTAGQAVEFRFARALLWRFGGLNHPSLALPSQRRHPGQ